jgi:hypothetical protein
MNSLTRDIGTLPLHDAIVQEIRICWNQKRVVLTLDVFLNPKLKAEPCELIFYGVTNIEISHYAPWGESSCINAVRFEENNFRIEMQTGDILSIEASSYEFQELPL